MSVSAYNIRSDVMTSFFSDSRILIIITLIDCLLFYFVLPWGSAENQITHEYQGRNFFRQFVEID